MRRRHIQSGWIKAWFILFDYPVYSVIWHGSGIKRPDIIEVLLYMYFLNLKSGALTASCVSEGLLGSHYSNLSIHVTVQPFYYM